MKHIKKSLMFLVILALAIFLSGCLNYKTYYDTNQDTESDLIKEIAQIEKELGLSEKKTTVVVDTTKGEDTLKEETIVNVSLTDKRDLSNLQKITVNENEIASIDVKIDDPDKDQITYGFSLPLNDAGKWKTNYGDAGEYVVTITASDGKLTSKKDVLLIVKRVNVKPIIKQIKDQTIKEGETVKIEPQVIDPNGDSVTVTVSEPLASKSWTTDHTSSGEYQITVTASDGELTNTQTFLLKVTDVNELPEIKGLKDMTFDEGEEIEFKLKVSDLDKDTVKTTIVVTCVSSCQFLSSGDVAKTFDEEGLWKTSYTDHGVYKVVVTSDDGKGKSIEEATLTINDKNQAPTIGEIKLG